ncbi:MAG: hypothetical protein GY737_22095 [Desulfobacteraceae bacterium]|nr:hypothetical protein [Desulfobacteraceae bacterium]
MAAIPPIFFKNQTPTCLIFKIFFKNQTPTCLIFQIFFKKQTSACLIFQTFFKKPMYRHFDSGHVFQHDHFATVRSYVVHTRTHALAPPAAVAMTPAHIWCLANVFVFETEKQTMWYCASLQYIHSDSGAVQPTRSS